MDAAGFRISRDEAFAAIMPTVKKTSEYAKDHETLWWQAMRRLDEAADPSKVDAAAYRDAYQGRIQLDGLCDQLAPKYVVPAGGWSQISQRYLHGIGVPAQRAGDDRPSGSFGFRTLASLISSFGDTQGE